MVLTQGDLCGIDNKSNNGSNKTIDNEDEEDEKETDGSDYYNPNFTLRKCSSKIIDALSNLFPKEVYENINQHLETGMQNQNWLVKYN